MPGKSIFSRIEAGQFVRSLQIDPPTPHSIQKFGARLAKIKEAKVEIIDINTSKLEPSADSLVVAARAAEEGLVVIPHIAVRDNGLRRFVNQIFGQYFLYGLRDVLVIKGDPYKLRGLEGECDLNSIHLINEIDRELRIKKACSNLRLAAAFNQNTFNLNYELERLRCKADIGVDYFMTQPVFDKIQLEILTEAFRANCAKPLLVGIFPLPYWDLISAIKTGAIAGINIPMSTVAEAGKFIESFSEEALKKWAIEKSVALISEVRRIKEISGVYIVTPRRMPSVALEIFKQTCE